VHSGTTPPTDPRIRAFCNKLAEAVAESALGGLQDETGESATPESNGARRPVRGEASAIKDENGGTIAREVE